MARPKACLGRICTSDRHNKQGGLTSDEHGKKDNADAPDIDRLRPIGSSSTKLEGGLVFANLERLEQTHFRGYVWQTPAPFAQQARLAALFEFVYGAQTKIGYLENAPCVKHNVLRFYVTMTDTFSMDIVLGVEPVSWGWMIAEGVTEPFRIRSV